MSNQHHLEDQPHANVWLGNPSSVPAYPSVLSHPQPHYENQPSTPAATMIPIPVADPAALLSDQQQEPVISTTHSEGKQKKPNTKAPRRRPPPIGKNLRVIKSKTSPSLEIYQFEWRAEVANVDQGSTSFAQETMEQQSGSQNHFNAVQPGIQQNTNWLGEQLQYPVQDWSVLDPQSQQSLSQSPQVWDQTQHMYPLINQGEQPQGISPQHPVQLQNQFIADDHNQAAQFAYSAEGYQLKQTAKRSGHTRIMAAYQRYLAQRATHPSQQLSIPGRPTDSRVYSQRYHPYQHSSMSPTIYQERPPAHQDQMSSGMNVLFPPPDYCQPSYQSSGTSSSSAYHASASAFMTPVSNETYSHSPYGTTFDAESFQIPPAEHCWDQFQAQSSQTHQQQYDLRELWRATSELACDSYHSQAIQDSTAEETANVEDRNGQAFDNKDMGDDGSLFGDDNDGRGLALPGSNAQADLLLNQLALPGSTNTAVQIPAANDSICADEVAKEDFLFAAFAAESSEPSASVAPVPQVKSGSAYTAPVAEDFDYDAEVRKAYDSFNSPSASPAVLPASNPVRRDKGKSRKRDSAKKTTEIEYQFNDDSILDRFSRALVQFQDPHPAWVHPNAVSLEPLKQSRDVKLVKIPDCPPGVVCCLPPLQYTHNEQGQVVNVIEEVTTETTSICFKRKICSFAIDTATPSEVELHFYFHRVAMENCMRAAHAAGVPSAYQCMWHYDERDKTDFQREARGFRRGIFCHEVSFSNNTFNTYNDLAQHWNIHTAHKLLRQFCPIPRCVEVVSNEGGSRLAEHLAQCHRGYIFETYCL